MSKFRFWSSSNKWRWIKSEIQVIMSCSEISILNSLKADQKLNNFDLFRSEIGVDQKQNCFHVLHVTNSSQFGTGSKIIFRCTSFQGCASYTNSLKSFKWFSSKATNRSSATIYSKLRKLDEKWNLKWTFKWALIKINGL